MSDAIISQRRTIKPASMNGQIIPDEMITHLLQLADWAPTHGRTEPWRFIVYGNKRMQEFATDHAALYRDNTPGEKFREETYEKLLHRADGASHTIIAYMKRGANPKIPEIEEIAATSAAIQNILLGASANGIASFWSTGGLTHDTVMKDHLGLREEDRILGILYLGYSDQTPREGKRSVPLDEKILWYR